MSNFVHMCGFDLLSTILKEEMIDRKDFVSFTNGMPLILGHGDTAIIFNKEKLLRKGYTFQEVKYDKIFLNKNPEIKKHVLAHKTKKQLQEENFRRIDQHIDKVNNVGWSESKINQEIKMARRTKKLIRRDVIDYFLSQISYEKEWLIESPFKFDIEDIVAIIHSSKTFNEYYPVDSKYMSKMVFVEDFDPIQYLNPSPLFDWMLQKKEQLDEYVNSGDEFDVHILELYQLVYSLILNPEWEQYTRSQQKPLISLPSQWDAVFKKMHTIGDIGSKIEAIDFVFKYYILEILKDEEREKGKSKLIEDHENLLLHNCR